MTTTISKHLRRICPTLLVRDAAAACAYYRDRLGFTIIHSEEHEFAVVDRDGCRVMLKRGTPAFNRDRCSGGGSMEFYDLFIHCDSMPAFDALYTELQGRQPIALGPIESWSGMRLFPTRDLDGYKIYFARSI
ncbi:MAG TPA: VOC family protein [Tepidisphaeraceae bacterium]|jgi:catechol 2,3-dioxygenase-like lactoylglutathione lyase family enzyme